MSRRKVVVGAVGLGCAALLLCGGLAAVFGLGSMRPASDSFATPVMGTAATQPEPVDETPPVPVDETPPAPAARCPEGSHVFMFWQGEYPQPVVSVTREVELKGRADPCDETATASCRVPTWLYHPWTEGGLGYATIRGIDRYRTTREVELWETTIAAGTDVEVIGYFGEGICQFRIGGEELDDGCPGVGDDDAFQELSASAVR